MAKKLMTKTYCDFCEKEIEKSKPTVKGPVHLDGRLFEVEIRLGSSERKKRFGHDICRDCVFRAVAQMSFILEPETEAEREVISEMELAGNPK